MRGALAQRILAVAAAALLGAVVALAIADRESSPRERRTTTLPQAVGAPDGAWYEALAAIRAKAGRGDRSACGYLLTRSTLGVGHPVLPCGTKLYLTFAGKRVLTQVVDRGPSASGREFDLTPALARLLRLHGVQSVRWAFARP